MVRLYIVLSEFISKQYESTTKPFLDVRSHTRCDRRCEQPAWTDGNVLVWRAREWQTRRDPVGLATLSLHLCSEWTHRILPRRRRRRRFRDNLISRDVVGSAAERPALTSPSSPAARSIDNDPTSCPQFQQSPGQTSNSRRPSCKWAVCERNRSQRNVISSKWRQIFRKAICRMSLKIKQTKTAIELPPSSAQQSSDCQTIPSCNSYKDSVYLHDVILKPTKMARNLAQ